MAQEIQNNAVICLEEEHSGSVEENNSMLQDYDSKGSVPSNKSLSSHVCTNSTSQMITDNKQDVLGKTIIAFTREVTKRLEMERKHEYNMLKLKYEHKIEMKTTGTLMNRSLLM